MMKHLSLKTGLIVWTVGMFVLPALACVVYMMVETNASLNEIGEFILSGSFLMAVFVYWIVGGVCLSFISVINKITR